MSLAQDAPNAARRLRMDVGNLGQERAREDRTRDVASVLMALMDWERYAKRLERQIKEKQR